MGWEQEAARQRFEDGEPADVLITTRDLDLPYRVLDVVMCLWEAGRLGQLFGETSDLMSGRALGNTEFGFAKARLQKEAARLGANAIIGASFAIDRGSDGWTFLAYGTAVDARFVPPAFSAHPGKVLVDAELPQYIKLFSERRVTAEVLGGATDADLARFGVDDVEHRSRILAAIDRHRES